MGGKTIIVLVAFPVLVHAVFTVTTLLLGLMLPQLLAAAGNWSEVLSKAVVVATFLIAVRIAFGVCRRLWPAAAMK
jgi:hypothetical protein